MAEIQDQKVYRSELVLNKSLWEEHNGQGTGLWQKLSVFGLFLSCSDSILITFDIKVFCLSHFIHSVWLYSLSIWRGTSFKTDLHCVYSVYFKNTTIIQTSLYIVGTLNKYWMTFVPPYN